MPEKTVQRGAGSVTGLGLTRPLSILHVDDDPTNRLVVRQILAAFYSQHVWAWKRNPAGPLAMWNPNVHC